MSKKKWLFLSFLLFSFLLLLPGVTQAKISTSDNVLITKDETINDNFIVVGNNVDIAGTVNGDVIAGSGTLTISGTVQGDVIAGSGTIKIDGEVMGNVRVGAGDVTINGKVGKNVNIFSGTALIGKDAEIGWSLSFALGTIEIRGIVRGNVDGAAGSVIIANEIGNNVNLRLDREGNLTIYPEAIIGGNLTYSGSEEANIMTGAQIKGETTFKKITQKTGAQYRFFGVSYLFFRIASLFGALVVGLVLLSFASGKVKKITDIMWTRPWPSLGWGAVYLIIIPIVIVVLMITMIGIPLALILSGIYLLFAYLAKIFVGILIGERIFKLLKRDNKSGYLFWPFILGMVIYVLVTSIPIVGWLVNILAIIWAFGAVATTIQNHLTKKPSTK